MDADLFFEKSANIYRDNMRKVQNNSICFVIL